MLGQSLSFSLGPIAEPHTDGVTPVWSSLRSWSRASWAMPELRFRNSTGNPKIWMAKSTESELQRNPTKSWLWYLSRWTSVCSWSPDVFQLVPATGTGFDEAELGFNVHFHAAQSQYNDQKWMCLKMTCKVTCAPKCRHLLGKLWFTCSCLFYSCWWMKQELIPRRNLSHRNISKPLWKVLIGFESRTALHK